MSRYCLLALQNIVPLQTQHICITFVQRRPVGPVLCYTDVLCLLGWASYGVSLASPALAEHKTLHGLDFDPPPPTVPLLGNLPPAGVHRCTSEGVGSTDQLL